MIGFDVSVTIMVTLLATCCPLRSASEFMPASHLRYRRGLFVGSSFVTFFNKQEFSMNNSNADCLPILSNLSNIIT
jgi:hypothetical protein